MPNHGGKGSHGRTQKGCSTCGSKWHRHDQCPTKSQQPMAAAAPPQPIKARGRGKTGSRHYANPETAGSGASVNGFIYHSSSAASWHRLPNMDASSPVPFDSGLTGTATSIAST
eukprot:8283843-Pyramimonas_sp.AAC.1